MSPRVWAKTFLLIAFSIVGSGTLNWMRNSANGILFRKVIPYSGITKSYSLKECGSPIQSTCPTGNYLTHSLCSMYCAVQLHQLLNSKIPLTRGSRCKDQAPFLMRKHGIQQRRQALRSNNGCQEHWLCRVTANILQSLDSNLFTSFMPSFCTIWSLEMTLAVESKQ